MMKEEEEKDAKKIIKEAEELISKVQLSRKELIKEKRESIKSEIRKKVDKEIQDTLESIVKKDDNIWTNEDEERSWNEVNENDIVLIGLSSITGGIFNKVNSIVSGVETYMSVPFHYHFMTSDMIVSRSTQNLSEIRLLAQAEISRNEMLIKVQRQSLVRYTQNCEKRRTFPEKNKLNKYCIEIKKFEDIIAKKNKQTQKCQQMEDKLNEATTRKELYYAMDAIIVLASRSGGDIDKLEEFRERYDEANDTLRDINEMAENYEDDELDIKGIDLDTLRERILDESGIVLSTPAYDKDDKDASINRIPKPPNHKWKEETNVKQ